MTNYSFLITLKKLIKQGIIAFIAIFAAGLLDLYPQVANYSILGGWTIYFGLNALVDYLKHRWGVNLP
jgi:hypothetical protein